MKRCNHKLCALVAHAARQTCWLEADDIPDPVKILEAIVGDPGAHQLSTATLVEVDRFLRKFKEAETKEEAASGFDPKDPEEQEITDVVDVREYLKSLSAEGVIISGEGEA